jgi:hypothetical protein
MFSKALSGIELNNKIKLTAENLDKAFPEESENDATPEKTHKKVQNAFDDDEDEKGYSSHASSTS